MINDETLENLAGLTFIAACLLFVMTL